tara:strand:+ start:65 stop:589 length:525 start_codon:yes stop_codon:yes gene_type:complete
MKKLLLLLLFIPLISFGQNNNTNVSVKSGDESVVSKALDRNQEMRDRKAINYLGDGIYEIIRVGGGSVKKNKEKYMMEELNEVANQLVIQKGAKSFKIIFKDFDKMILLQQPALLNVKIQLLDDKGNPKLEKNESKEDAKNQLIELKGFLDLGIITQEEFDKKAESLKKILLGN